MTLASCGADASKGLGWAVCLGIDEDDPLLGYASSLVKAFEPLKVRLREQVLANAGAGYPGACSRTMQR